MEFKKNTLRATVASVLALSVANGVHASGNGFLTLYNQNALFGKESQVELINNKFFIETPSSILKDTLIVASQDKEVTLTKKVHKINDFDSLLRENIGQEILVDDKKGILKSIGNGYFVVEQENKPFYFKSHEIKSFYFPKQIPLKAGVFEVTTKGSDKRKSLNVEYSYIFSGISWYGNHQLFINDNDELTYYSELAIENGTDQVFEDINLSLLAGDIKMEAYNPRMMRATAMADSVGMSKEVAEFEGFEGFQKLTYPENVSIDGNTTTYLDFQSFENFPYERTYVFNGIHINQHKQENIKPAIELKLKRDSEKFQFPFVKGKLSVFKGENISNSTLLTHQSVPNYSEDQDIEIKLGEAFDVYLSYSSTQLEENVKETKNVNNRKVSDVEYVYEYDLKITNNQDKEVAVEVPFISSDNFQEPFKITVSANDKLNKKVVVKYTRTIYSDLK